ncbi:Hypothetical predicted protein [Paramuricea clavata]|uniref:Uncharacterized protein n=1 Tax=Paramuricea clavata TaxID=317549 RepID=A0A7D9DVI8_PARCT|nr:Hypothetical predicted protein [Paramuricea clavata]
MSCIHPNQYGFIPGSCTTLALISLIHRWTETVDARDGIVRALLTDYRKAFDLIDHNVLCQKLQQIEYASSLQDVTHCIVNWSTYNQFELSPTKCKEIVINFQRNEPVFPPIKINEINVERIEKAMILGLLITQDMKWNAHVDKITTKAAKRLYLMKQLKRLGLSDNDLKCFYIASIRSILKYACQVFHYGLPEYLSDQIYSGIRRELCASYAQTCRIQKPLKN